MVAVVVRFRLHAIARLNTLRLVRRVQRRQEAEKKRKHYAARSGYPQVIFSGAVRFSELQLAASVDAHHFRSLFLDGFSSRPTVRENKISLATELRIVAVRTHRLARQTHPPSGSVHDR
jgi:hypothetical protein